MSTRIGELGRVVQRNDAGPISRKQVVRLHPVPFRFSPFTASRASSRGLGEGGSD